jgi:hypothetical protein
VLGDDALSEADRQHINKLNAKVARLKETGGNERKRLLLKASVTPRTDIRSTSHVSSESFRTKDSQLFRLS